MKIPQSEYQRAVLRHLARGFKVRSALSMANVPRTLAEQRELYELGYIKINFRLFVELTLAGWTVAQVLLKEQRWEREGTEDDGEGVDRAVVDPRTITGRSTFERLGGQRILPAGRPERLYIPRGDHVVWGDKSGGAY